MQEPTGLRVQGKDGEVVSLTFPAFVAAIEDDAILPDDQVWSRIITGAEWVRAGDMRLFRILMEERQAIREDAGRVWPPPPQNSAPAD